jgi:hypothetical protein
MFMALKASSARQRQQQEQQHRRNRVADRPGGDVHDTTRHHAAGRIEPRDFDAVLDAAAGRYLDLPQLVAFDAEHIGKSLAQQQRRLRYRQRGLGAKAKLTAREHAGADPPRRIGRQVDIHQGGMGPRIHRRRQHPHLALQPLAGRGGYAGRHTRPQARQVRGGDLGAPFQATAANQAEQFLARLHRGANRGTARRDDSGIGRQDLGLGFPQPGALPARLRRRKPRLGGFRRRLRLGELLGTVEAFVAQLARALETGPRLGQTRLGLGDAGACFGKLRYPPSRVRCVPATARARRHRRRRRGLRQCDGWRSPAR